MKFVKAFISSLMIAIVCVLITGCPQKKAVSWIGFTYPEGKDVFGGDWQYRGMISVTSDQPGSEYKESEKTVVITVVNSDKQKLLAEEMKFKRCAGIGAKVNWDKFEELFIDLEEEINRGDKVNKNGVKVSDVEKRHLRKLHFQYDEENEKFDLINSEERL